METIKVLLIGAGLRGRAYPDIMKEIGGCEVVAVADPDDGRRNYIKETHNIPEEMCFKTCLAKDPDWKHFGLLHILDIMGYEVFEETEAGYFANNSYRRFINQINKAIRFYKAVVCRECGQILFPAHEHGQARFKCVCPTCTEFNKVVYINNCYNCKKGLIDSRDTTKCPNGTYICPECSSCCSNSYYESLALRYTKQGKAIPKSISMNIGKGHADINVFYCSKCGSQKVYSGINNSGEKEYTCPKCGKPIQTN